MIVADEEGSKLEERLPIVDMPMDGTEPQASSLKRNIIETKLISQLETEISGLLGSIKVQASSIKETLKKQKSILIADGDDNN